MALTAVPTVRFGSGSLAQEWLPVAPRLSRTSVLEHGRPSQWGPDGNPRPYLPGGPRLTLLCILNTCPVPGSKLVLPERKEACLESWSVHVLGGRDRAQSSFIHAMPPLAQCLSQLSFKSQWPSLSVHVPVSLLLA